MTYTVRQLPGPRSPGWQNDARVREGSPRQRIRRAISVSRCPGEPKPSVTRENPLPGGGASRQLVAQESGRESSGIARSKGLR